MNVKNIEVHGNINIGTKTEFIKTRNKVKNKYVGVSLQQDSRRKKDAIKPWRARYARYIMHEDGEKYHREILVGNYATKIEAALAYNCDVLMYADMKIHDYVLNTINSEGECNG